MLATMATKSVGMAGGVCNVCVCVCCLCALHMCVCVCVCVCACACMCVCMHTCIFTCSLIEVLHAKLSDLCHLLLKAPDHQTILCPCSYTATSLADYREQQPQKIPDALIDWTPQNRTTLHLLRTWTLAYTSTNTQVLPAMYFFLCGEKTWGWEPGWGYS